MIRIGLTGNIACGKSTVAAMLGGMGAMVIDSDKVAHQVMRRGSETYRRAVQRFGQRIVGGDGEIDRRELGAIVFADPAALRDLDNIVHPAVMQRVEEMIAAADPPPAVVMVEAVKLIEAGMAAACDSVWAVTCSPEVAVRRLMETRGLTEEQAWARLAAQGSDAEKLGRADVIIRNDGDLADTRRQVQAAWAKAVGSHRLPPSP